MKFNFLIVASLICMVLLIVSGCTTSCIPVHPSQVIQTDSGRCVAIIDNTSYEVSYSSDCSKIIPGQTNKVFFYGNGAMGPGPSSSINGVCQP